MYIPVIPTKETSLLIKLLTQLGLVRIDFLFDIDVCVKAESMRLTASLKLKECRDDKLQKFRPG